MLRNLNPKTKIWDGVNAEFTPYSDDLPWCMIPEKKITVEDVKYVLSSHYQGTSYDPYASYGEKEQRGAFRSIGVNRTDFLSLIQMRPGMEKDCNILEWVAFASNAFNVLVPFYATIDTTPDYFSSTTREVTTDSFYWVSRMIGAMADASYKSSIFHIERYQERVMSKGHQLIGKYDALMEKDPMSRVACETATTTGLVLVMGEITTNAYVDIQKIVRDTIREIGYTRGKYGFDADTCAVITAIDEQSADIALGVDKALEAKMGEDEIDAIGAGDQGIQFGYASNETEEYMPYAINMAHKLARQLTKIRKDGTLKYLRPDGKTQVTVEYDEAGKPIRIDAVVCSTQHDPDVTQEQIHEDIKKYVFDEIIPADMVDENTKFFINPTGRFVIGGPHGDSGVTGRKIIVDTYGGMARHGGGAFSGKDCTKVDRSASYAARYVAKNIVAAGLAKKCEIQLSYAIGVAHPTSIMVDTFGTGKISDESLVEMIRREFDLRPAGIIQMLDLRRPIYKQTAAYGHFGRDDINLPWERLDRVEELKKYLE